MSSIPRFREAPSDPLTALKEILGMEREALGEGDWAKVKALAMEACREIELLKEMNLARGLILDLLLESEGIEEEIRRKAKGIKEEIALIDLSLHAHRTYMEGSVKDEPLLEWKA
jgi:hypothetical protein